MNVETANRLVTLRKRAGLSQEDLADKIGVSRQAVSKWERAESSPDTDNLIALAGIYGIRIDDMLNRDTAATETNEAAATSPEKQNRFLWASFPYPIIVTIVFFLLLFDIIPNNNFPAWLVFLTIPIWGFFFTKGKGGKSKHRRDEASDSKKRYDSWLDE
jgi:transcriptional regulator with XRE-family HTH domain